MYESTLVLSAEVTATIFSAKAKNVGYTSAAIKIEVSIAHPLHPTAALLSAQ